MNISTNISTDINTFDLFYNLKDVGFTSQIMKTISNTYKVDLNKLNIIILSVINLSSNGYTNNPPNPPYINLYELIYYAQINKKEGEKDKKLYNSLKNVLTKTRTYNFYKTNTIINKMYEGFDAIGDYSHSANTIIELIKRNNAASLIGNLELADTMVKLTHQIPCTDVPAFTNKLKLKFLEPEFEIRDDKSTDLEYKRKYFKYKNKYLKLKNKKKN